MTRRAVTRRAGRVAAVIVAAAVAATALLALLERRAAPHLLAWSPHATWILRDVPAQLQARPPRTTTVVFRGTAPRADATSVNAVLDVAALGAVRVAVNGRLVAPTQQRVIAGESTRTTVDVGALLVAGPNLVEVAVTRAWGSPVMRLTSTVPGLASDTRWQASADGARWDPVRAADARVALPDALSRWRVPEALGARWRALAALLAAGGAVAWALERRLRARGRAGSGAPVVSTTFVRAWGAVLVGALVALFAWNAGRLPTAMGMDIHGHAEYVDYLLARGRLPFADEGWQLFQPPLAYLVAAAAEVARARWAPSWPAIEAARTLAMACGVIAAAVACRACARALRPTPAAACLAMTVAVFLPAALYVAQAFGNEPFAAVFGTLLVAEVVDAFVGGGAPLDRARALRVGLWSGLGLLAKPTVLLMLPGVAVALGWRAWRTGGGDAAAAAVARAGLVALRAAQAGAVCAVVAGWWYLRNVAHFGRPFVGGWEPGRGFDWWQYPGYRIAAHVLRFGEALVHPYYPGVDSFWDAVHASLWLDGALSGMLDPSLVPWDHGAMASLSPLALPIVAAIVAGAARALFSRGAWTPVRALALFCAATVGVLLAAMLVVYAGVPAYSPAKGSYLLPAAACLAILAGHGAAPLLARRAGRVAAGAFGAAWLGFVAMAFVMR